MLVKGANNLGLPVAAPAVDKKSSQAKEQSSFEQLLSDKSAAQEKPARQDKPSTQDKPATQDRPRALNTKSNRPLQSSKRDPLEKRVEADGLPTPDFNPIAPPVVADRIPGSPVLPSESIAPSKGVVVPVGEGESSVDALTHRVVWNEFLRKMKDEFGVSIEDIMQAFASLSPEDLVSPVAQSADKVVAALGLQGAEAQTAQKYLNELISKTESRSLGEELGRSSHDISLTLMSQREMQRRTLQKSLDGMSKDFFLNTAEAKARLAAEAQAMAQAQALQGQMVMPNPWLNPESTQNQETVLAPPIDPSLRGSTAGSLATGTSPADVTAATPGSAAWLSQVSDAAGSQNNSGKSDINAASKNSEAANTSKAANAGKASAPILAPHEMNRMIQAMQQNEAQNVPVGKDAQSIDEVVKKFASSQAPSALATNLAAGAGAGVGSSAATGAGSAAAGATSQMSTAPLSSLASLMGLNNGSRDENQSEDGEFSTDASYLAQVPTQDSVLNSANADAFKAELNAAGAPQPTMAVPELVEQAQLMVRDGGGEMKVTLNQEGLGEVAMKVSVEHGKVSVQMITESDEAKRLIERELSDLKSSLNNQNLQVEGIKIDTATNVGKQLDQQYQDAHRQMTQASMEQFRQDSQGWRRSFFESPSVRGAYRSQGSAQRDKSAPATSSSNARRRLDLVA